jgi:hypothetical protein
MRMENKEKSTKNFLDGKLNQETASSYQEPHQKNC